MDTNTALAAHPEQENEIISEAVLADLAKDHLLNAIHAYDNGDSDAAAELMDQFLFEVRERIREDTGADADEMEDPGVMDHGMHERGAA